MIHTLLAIYVIVHWHLVTGKDHWQEFQLSQHFFSRDVCEYYRPKLVSRWTDDPRVPFNKSQIDSSRCAPWQPDPHAEIKLWNGETNYGEDI